MFSNALRIAEDGETKWWSTLAMVDRENARKLHEQVYKCVALLSASHWAISRLSTRSVIEPLMTGQTLLERKKYVTVSLLVP